MVLKLRSIYGETHLKNYSAYTNAERNIPDLSRRNHRNGKSFRREVWSRDKWLWGLGSLILAELSTGSQRTISSCSGGAMLAAPSARHHPVWKTVAFFSHTFPLYLLCGRRLR
jgi:hypothetical protein